MSNISHKKTGWTDAEIALLKEQVLAGGVLSEIFERVARQTGRQPNSVRNFYYAYARQNAQLKNNVSTFTPFNRDETRVLVSDMLTLQYKGDSVRSAAMKIGDNDKTKMLRAQNKYRSVIKSDPALVCEVMDQLRREKCAFFNPYENITLRGRRPKGEPLSATLSEIIKNLNMLSVDAHAFFDGLLELSRMAAENTVRQNIDEQLYDYLKKSIG